jgi:hypothetical protein
LKADHKTKNGHPKAQDFPRLSHPAFASVIIEYGIIAELCPIRLMPLPFQPAVSAGSTPNQYLNPVIAVDLDNDATRARRHPPTFLETRKSGSEKPSL